MTDLKFTKDGSKEWPASYEEAQELLERCRSRSSLDSILKGYDFSPTLKENVVNWTYSEVVCSALTFIFSDIEISVYAWSVITAILMNLFLTDDILLFLKNNFFYNSSIRHTILKGVSFAFNYKTFPFGNEKCVRNVLDFIEIDKNETKKLLDSFSVKKDFKEIAAYLFVL